MEHRKYEVQLYAFVMSDLSFCSLQKLMQTPKTVCLHYGCFVIQSVKLDSLHFKQLCSKQLFCFALLLLK